MLGSSLTSKEVKREREGCQQTQGHFLSCRRAFWECSQAPLFRTAQLGVYTSWLHTSRAQTARQGRAGMGVGRVLCPRSHLHCLSHTHTHTLHIKWNPGK